MASTSNSDLQTMTEKDTDSSLERTDDDPYHEAASPTADQPANWTKKDDLELGCSATATHTPETLLHAVTTLSDWDGPEDCANPQNWPLRRRIYYIIAPGALALSVSVASSLITPGTDLIAQEFKVSKTAAILTLSLYSLGLGLGPALAAGPSETYGRAVVYKISFFIFMLFTLGAGYSHTFAALLVTRFFAGCFGGPVLAIGAGTMADVFPPHTRAFASTVFVSAPFLGPVLGPIIGGYAVAKGWRWTQWCTLFISFVSFIVALPMSETYKRVILERRAKKLGLEPSPRLGPKGTLPAMKFFATVTLVRPIHMLFTEPIVAFASMYTSFCFAILFAYFAAYPYVYTKVYHFTVGQTGLTFLALGVGVLAAATTVIVLNRTIYMRKYREALKEGKSGAAPEHR